MRVAPPVVCALVLLLLPACGGSGGNGSADASSDGGVADAPSDGGRLVNAWLATGGFQVNLFSTAAGAQDVGPHVEKTLNANAAGDPANGTLYFVVWPEDVSENEARLTWGLAQPMSGTSASTYRFLSDPPPQTSSVHRVGFDGGAWYLNLAESLPVTLRLVPPEGDPSSTPTFGASPVATADGGAYTLKFQVIAGGTSVQLEVGVEDSALGDPGWSYTPRTDLCRMWADGLNMLDVASQNTADLTSCTCPSSLLCPERFRGEIMVRNWTAITLAVD